MNDLSVIKTEQGAIATLTLNRPEQYNALSMGVLEQLQEKFLHGFVLLLILL